MQDVSEIDWNEVWKAREREKKLRRQVSAVPKGGRIPAGAGNSTRV